MLISQLVYVCSLQAEEKVEVIKQLVRMMKKHPDRSKQTHVVPRCMFIVLCTSTTVYTYSIYIYIQCMHACVIWHVGVSSRFVSAIPTFLPHAQSTVSLSQLKVQEHPSSSSTTPQRGQLYSGTCLRWSLCKATTSLKQPSSLAPHSTNIALILCSLPV